MSDDVPPMLRTQVATFSPRRLDNLKPEARPFVGVTMKWRGLWVVTEEDGGPYVGQVVWEPDDSEHPRFGWVPDEDLIFVAPPAMTLSDFLLARIAEDEALALLVADDEGREWSVDSDGDGMVVGGAEAPKQGYYHDGRALWDNEDSSSLSMALTTARFVAEHDPARVLAECAAKRAIVEAHAEASAYYSANMSAPAGELQGLVFAIAALAAVYGDHADHPDRRRA